jgi:hypothetical protein
MAPRIICQSSAKLFYLKGIPVFLRQISMDTLWIHMNRNHEGILFRALRAEDGTIHISGKRKKESNFSPDGLNALYCLEVVKDDASSQSFDLEIAIRNGLRPPKRAYYHMTNFRKVAIGEWMLDIDPEDSIDLMWRNQMDEAVSSSHLSHGAISSLAFAHLVRLSFPSFWTTSTILQLVRRDS